MRSVSKAMISLIVISLISLTMVFAQTPLTNDAVVKMVKAGIGEDVILSMINSQPNQFIVTPDAMITLKKDGVSDKIIAAMVSKPPAATTSATAGAASVPATAAPVPAANADDKLEIGVYFKKNNEMVEIMPEVVNWKSGGILKSIASAGVVKGDVNGNVSGAQSRNRVTVPLEFVVKTPEGIAISEYQLIHLHEHKSDREFRTVTGGVFHQSGGANRDLVDFEGKRISNRTYRIVLPDSTEAGEYGFLPPGAFTSANSASIGKMYTFRVVE